MQVLVLVGDGGDLPTTPATNSRARAAGTCRFVEKKQRQQQQQQQRRVQEGRLHAKGGAGKDQERPQLSKAGRISNIPIPCRSALLRPL